MRERRARQGRRPGLRLKVLSPALPLATQPALAPQSRSADPLQGLKSLTSGHQHPGPVWGRNNSWMPTGTPEASGPAGPARLAAGRGPGCLHHIAHRLAKRHIFHGPDSSSRAWALPVQLFQHLLLLKCIYYTERSNDGVGARASGAEAAAPSKAVALGGVTVVIIGSASQDEQWVKLPPVKSTLSSARHIRALNAGRRIRDRSCCLS